MVYLHIYVYCILSWQKKIFTSLKELDNSLPNPEHDISLHTSVMLE